MSHASVASAREGRAHRGVPRDPARLATRQRASPARSPPAAPPTSRAIQTSPPWRARVPDATDRLKALIACGADLVDLPDEAKALHNRVMGCASEAWIDLTLAADGTVVVRGAAEAQITRGFCGVLAKGLTGLTADAIADVGFHRGRARRRRREPAHQPRERVPEHAGDGEEAGEALERLV